MIDLDKMKIQIKDLKGLANLGHNCGHVSKQYREELEDALEILTEMEDMIRIYEIDTLLDNIPPNPLASLKFKS